MSPGERLRWTLRRDRLFHVALAAGLLCIAASRATSTWAPAWGRLANDLADLLMLSLVLTALLRDLGSLAPLERRFWQVLSAGIVSWLLVTLTNLAAPGPTAASALLPLLRSLGYTAIYFWVILALELKPHVRPVDAAESGFRWLEGGAASLTALGLFVYFGLIPWALGTPVWATNVPKLALYLTLDGLLLLRLGLRSLRAFAPAWRTSYRCLLVVVACWAATDSLELLGWAGWLGEGELSFLFDVLWLPPMLALVLAARTQRAAPVELALAEAAALPSTPSRGGLLLAQTLILPVLHTSLVGLDAWDAGRHAASWLWALALPLGLAGLSGVYLHGVERLAAARAGRLAGANRDLEATVAALRSARDEADAANAVKTRFLAAMSHEIRTPMNGVLGTLSLLRRTTLSDAQQRLADTIQRSGHALLAIIDEILDLSRLEAGRLGLRSEAFDVAAAIEDVAESLAELAWAKPLELVCVVEGLREPLRGDRDRFRQVLVNLLGNAIKFTERGEVAVFARELARDDDSVTVLVDVADTGIGIPPEAAGLVFEAFGQAASGRRSGSGTGLGLTISRQLAALMGGDIWFESAAGRGSVFHLKLTLGRAAEPEATRCVPVHGVRRALVVESNSTSRFALERHCAELGIDTRAVADSEAARRALREAATQAAAFDVAFVEEDLLVAENGLLLRCLRTDRADATLVALRRGAAVSGSEPPGVACVLSKPVLRRSLLEALAAPPGGGTQPEAPGLETVAALPERRGLALVVEDNPVNQAVAEGMLRVLGFEAHLAEDGASALQLLEQNRYDVVLMDCMMPGMDGFEVTAELRRRERTGSAPRTHVIAATAIAMAGDRERCLAAGMDDYLAKPFQLEVLEAILIRVLGADRRPTPVGAA